MAKKDLIASIYILFRSLMTQPVAKNCLALPIPTLKQSRQKLTSCKMWSFILFVCVFLLFVLLDLGLEQAPIKGLLLRAPYPVPPFPGFWFFLCVFCLSWVWEQPLESHIQAPPVKGPSLIPIPWALRAVRANHMKLGDAPLSPGPSGGGPEHRNRLID